LAGGPDIWELMATLKSGKASGRRAIAATAELLNLTDSQVRTAVRYYGASPRRDRPAHRPQHRRPDEAEAAWQREQAALP